jgi:alkanesulfonate monooxygenase SsuD/methylene tetrahydromethanopterin reductase-like flavin-dependent oxidoreductase (luciferase family)
MNSRIGWSIGSLLNIKNVMDFSAKVEEHEHIDSIWVPESWGKEAFSTLGAITQITKKVKLGTSIINIFSRTPATIAMGAISINNLSNNRMLLGLGASTSAIVENLHGIKYDNPILRMKEYIQSLRLLLHSEDKANYDGKTVKVRNFKILEKSNVEIPIYIAAVNKKMIQIGLNYADGLLFYLRPIREIKNLIQEIKYKDKINTSLVLITSVSNTEPQKAKERVAKTLAFYISVGKVYHNFLLKTEYKTEVEKIFKEYHTHGLERSLEHISTKMLDDFVIYGSINDCQSQLKRFIDTGIDLPILQINPIKDKDGELNYKDFLEL